MAKQMLQYHVIENGTLTSSTKPNASEPFIHRDTPRNNSQIVAFTG